MIFDQVQKLWYASRQTMQRSQHTHIASFENWNKSRDIIWKHQDLYDLYIAAWH